MFRFNNPDALLVLLMVAAAYATVRAIERAGTRWLLLAGVFIGFAFLAKMAQGFIVLPALVLGLPGGRADRLLAADPAAARRGRGGRRRRPAGGVAIVELWPASSRPYIGGSTDNSVLELALGYNGLGRIFGRRRAAAAVARRSRAAGARGRGRSRRRGRHAGGRRSRRWPGMAAGSAARPG